MFTVAKESPIVAGALLVLYPAWDALVNLMDAKRSGGIAANATQTFNAAMSVATTIAMAVAVNRGTHPVFFVFGVWAVVSGLLQLGTALRRWKQASAQWPMALSGAQSALAGEFFVKQSGDPSPMVEQLAGYAAVGALYLLISGSVLAYRQRKVRQQTGGA